MNTATILVVSEPAAPVPASPPTPPPDDPPVSDRYRSREPSSPAEIRRKLYFFAALILALGSVYSGLFGWRVAQYLLAGLAVLAVLAALVSGAMGAPRPPGPSGPPPGAAW
jgi:hypothetical protein